MRALLAQFVQMGFVRSAIVEFVLELLIHAPQFINLFIQFHVFGCLTFNLFSDGFLHVFELLLLDGLLLLVAQNQLLVLLILGFDVLQSCQLVVVLV